MKRIIVLFLLLTSYLAAAETVYAWGYGDLMLETFKVVKYIFSINEFQDVWKVAVIVGMLSGTIMMLTPNPDYLRLPKIIIFSVGIYTIFITAKIDIQVEDKADPTNSGFVANVPWAVGWPFAFFSTLEYRMGTMYETATTIPDGMKYSDSGFFTPVSIFSAATKHKIVSPYIFSNLNTYIQECVMQDLENGYKDYQSLVNSDNVWAYMGNTSPATFVMQEDASGNKSLMGCDTAYSALNTALQNYTSPTGAGMDSIAKSLGLVGSVAVSSQLGVANQYLMNSSQTASSFLLQNTAINTFSTSFRSYVLANGGDPDSAGFYASSAEAASSAQMLISGLLGAKYIPLMKGILTVIVLGLTPLLALLMITPLGFKTLMGYIMMLAWLASWHLGDVILNHIITTKVQTALSGYYPLTMAMKGVIDSTTVDYINMASSMYWSIPTIALIVVTGFSLSALASLNNAMSSKLDRTATSTGGEMGRGSINFGTVGHNNYSANSVNSVLSNAMGNSFSIFDNAGDYNAQSSAKGGSSRSEINSNVAQGMGLGAGNIGGNAAFGSAMAGLDKSLSGINLTGNETSLGNGRTNLTGSGTADNGTVIDNADVIKGKDGNIVSGTVNYTDGDGNKVEQTFANGKVVQTTATDTSGRSVELRKDDDGNISFKATSGTDDGGKSFVAGTMSRSGRAEDVTAYDINGVKYTKGAGTDTTLSESQSSAVNQALREAAGDTTSTSNTVNSGTGKSETTAISTGLKGDAQVGLKAFGTGITAGASVSLTGSDQFGSTYSVTNSDGQTKTFTLTQEQANTFNQAYQKATGSSLTESAQRDALNKDIKDNLNSSIDKGSTLVEGLSNITSSKDAMFNKKSENMQIPDYSGDQENIVNTHGAKTEAEKSNIERMYKSLEGSNQLTYSQMRNIGRAIESGEIFNTAALENPSAYTPAEQAKAQKNFDMQRELIEAYESKVKGKTGDQMTDPLLFVQNKEQEVRKMAVYAENLIDNASNLYKDLTGSKEPQQPAQANQAVTPPAQPVLQTQKTQVSDGNVGDINSGVKGVKETFETKFGSSGGNNNAQPVEEVKDKK